MPAVVAIANQKGGVGKTTTAAALAVVLSREGQRVVVIDMDPQASLTRVFKVRDDEGLLYQALKNRAELPLAPINEMLSVVPSSIHLASGESEFLAEPAREYMLQQSLQQTPIDDETLVILDCPPSLGILSLNCFATAQHVVVTLHPGRLEIDVLPSLQDAFRTVRKHLNPDLNILGVILTKADMRENMTSVVQRNIGQVYPLLGIVRSETALKYAMGDGALLTLQNSLALDSYRLAARKIVKHVWRAQTSAA